MSRLRVLWLFVIACAAGFAPTAAGGQTADFRLEGHSCEACHGTHREFSMELGNARAGESIVAQAFGLESESTRCLECHLDDGNRGQGPLADVPRINSDPAGGHPLGRVDVAEGFEFERPSRRSSPGRVSTGLIPGSGQGGAYSLQCSSCHDPHQTLISAVQVDAACLSCHEPGRYDMAGHLSVPCGGCHVVHADQIDQIRDGAQSELCGACHQGAPSSRRIRSGVEANLGPAMHLESRGLPCEQCHSPHGN